MLTKELLNALAPYAQESETNESTTAHLVKWWNDGEPAEILDFRDIPNASVQSLPPAAISLIQDWIQNLTLPEGLTQDELPPWLTELKALRQLNIPNYADEDIDLRHLRPSNLYRLHFNGGQLLKADVSQAEVFCSGTHIREQIRVNHYENDGTRLFSETAMGSPYYAWREDELDLQNLNAKGTFPDNEPIDCAPLVLQEISERQEEAKTKPLERHRTVRRQTHMETAERISESVSPDTARVHNEITRETPQIHIVGHTQLGNFVADRFEEIEIDSDGDGQQQFLSESPNHAMGMYLRVKRTADGRKRYVLTLFDPNLTHTHIRIVANNLDEIREWCLQNLVPSKYMEKYFEGENGAYFQSTFVAPITGDLNEIIGTGKPLFTPENDANREVVEYLSDSEELDPGQIFYPLTYNLPLNVEKINKQVSDFREPGSALTSEAPEDLMNFLNPGTETRFRAFVRAMEDENLVAIGDFGEVLKFTAENQILGAAELFIALTSSINPPALSAAMQKGKINAVKKFGEIVLDVGRNNFDSQVLTMLLAADDLQRRSAITRALENDQIEAAKEHGKTILSAYAENLISEDQLQTLSPSPNWFQRTLPLEFADSLAKTCQRKIDNLLNSMPEGEDIQNHPLANVMATLNDIRGHILRSHPSTSDAQILHAPLDTLHALLDSYQSASQQPEGAARCNDLLTMMQEEARETFEDTQFLATAPVHPSWERTPGEAPRIPPAVGIHAISKAVRSTARNLARNIKHLVKPPGIPPEEFENLMDALEISGLQRPSSGEPRPISFEIAGNYTTCRGRPVYADPKGNLYIARPLPRNDNGRVALRLVVFNRHEMTPEQAMIYVNKANRAARAIQRAERAHQELPNASSHLNIEVRTNTKAKERTKNLR